eukprot:4744208-Pleurochrysis_carterae.AAC.4
MVPFLPFRRALLEKALCFCPLSLRHAAVLLHFARDSRRRGRAPATLARRAALACVNTCSVRTARKRHNLDDS